MSINKHSVDSTKDPKGLQLQQMSRVPPKQTSNLGHSVQTLCLPKRNAGILVWIPSLQKQFQKTLQGMCISSPQQQAQNGNCVKRHSFDCRRTHFQDVQRCVGSTQAIISPFVSCSALPSMRLIFIINKNIKLPSNLKQKMTYHLNEYLPITRSPLQRTHCGSSKDR